MILAVLQAFKSTFQYYRDTYPRVARFIVWAFAVVSFINPAALYFGYKWRATHTELVKAEKENRSLLNASGYCSVELTATRAESRYWQDLLLEYFEKDAGK